MLVVLRRHDLSRSVCDDFVRRGLKPVVERQRVQILGLDRLKSGLLRSVH